MKYLFILLLFVGCYTDKQAQRDLIEAQLKKPNVVADFVSKNYPCDTIKGKIDTIEKVKWIRIVDSANRKIIIFRDTIKKIVYDTIISKDKRCEDRIKELKASLLDAELFIEGLQQTLNMQVPYVTQYVTIKDTAQILSKEYEIKKLKSELDNANSKRFNMFNWLVALLLIILLLILMYKFKR